MKPLRTHVAAAQGSAAPSRQADEPSALTPHLCLLGPPRLCVAGGREVELPNALPGYLMAYLAQRQDWVPREQLSTLFWPNAAPVEAQHNLRANVMRVRAWLEQQGQASALLAERTRLRWTLPCDVADAVPAAGAHQNPGLFLQGWTFGNFSLFAEWAQLQQQALLKEWRSRVLQADAHKAPESALRAAEQYLRTEPLDEEVVRHQLTALQALGRAGCTARAQRVTGPGKLATTGCEWPAGARARLAAFDGRAFRTRLGHAARPGWLWQIHPGARGHGSVG
jgi:hypothetical protein